MTTPEKTWEAKQPSPTGWGKAVALLAAPVFVALAALLALGYQSTLMRVHLVVDGQTRTVRTHQTTVGAVLREAGLTPFPEDTVEPELSARLFAGATVTITNLVIVRADQKFQPPLVYLTPLSYGFEPSTGYTTIACNCLIEFFGHTLDGESVYATGGIGINFADYAN